MVETSLPHLPDDALTRVLCVVAHPDDLEYGTSAAVAAWTARGIEVAYLLLTRGEAGMDGVEPARAAELRVREQVAGSLAVGVTQVDFLEHPDGVLVYGLDLRHDIAAAIRRFRPDAVLTTSWAEVLPYGLNQADHRAAGLAAVDAVRDAGNRWVFTDLLDAGLEPCSVRWVLVAQDPHPTHAVDVSGAPLQRAIASLEAHREYLALLPWHPAPADLIPAVTRAQGRALGVEHAVALRAIDLQAPPPALDGTD
ncbi:PIG-L deacetylase family protein [Cellulomonas sp. S1-8]|uniref:PIG-L deacetylase family protein n=1 Tax=Cellulomonas sp. S1-8 TaxID=2904790 RepID=UPI0022432C57|nr:PIG-L deacetylase family protein [Cellulomonas sp. S1-8]UZN02795.1 PIG-L family deacetylase [Cellulomonas sp. S1-8]